MNKTSLIATVLGSLSVGGIAGAGINQLVLNVTTQVSCILPQQPTPPEVINPPAVADLDLSRLMTPTRIPLTGYKSY